MQANMMKLKKGLSMTFFVINPVRKILAAASIFCALTLGVGCSSTLLLSYEGRRSLPWERIAWCDAAGASGVWKTLDLNIHYRCERGEDRLTLSGKVTFTPATQNHSRLVQFHAVLLLLDSDGLVVDTLPLATSSPSASPRLPVAFTREIPLSRDYAGFSFAYTGFLQRESYSIGYAPLSGRGVVP